MVIIRLTQKLQKEMGIKSSGLNEIQNSLGAFEEWYAHLFFMDRRKYVIFVEVQTLFSFVIENVSRKDIQERLPEILEKGLGRALFTEGVSSEVMSEMMSLFRDGVVFTKTENRRAIGAMNELVKHHKYSFYDHDRAIDVQDCYNRRMPMRGFPDGSKEYKFPMDVFAEALKQEWNINFKPQEFDFFKESFVLNQEIMF